MNHTCFRTANNIFYVYNQTSDRFIRYSDDINNIIDDVIKYTYEHKECDVFILCSNVDNILCDKCCIWDCPLEMKVNISDYQYIHLRYNNHLKIISNQLESILDTDTNDYLESFSTFRKKKN